MEGPDLSEAATRPAMPATEPQAPGPFRLPRGGRLIDRAFPAPFRFDGRHLRGFRGDTLAAALLGAGVGLVGRSFKYHRPRGLLASGAEEPNGLVGLGQGGRFEPNQRLTPTALLATTPSVGE